MVFARDALSRAMRVITQRSRGDRRADELRRDRRGSVTRARRRRRVRHPRLEAADRLSGARLPARVLQQPHRVVEAGLHAVRDRRLPGMAARPPGGARRVVARLHVRGHRAHVPGAQGPARREASVPGRMPARPRRGDRGAGHRAQARRAAGALAAGDPRDVVGVPAHVLQQALRGGRPARDAVLPPLGDRGARLRADGDRDAAGGSCSGARRLVALRARVAGDHAREQRLQHRSTADGRPPGTRLPQARARSGSSR